MFPFQTNFLYQNLSYGVNYDRIYSHFYAQTIPPFHNQVQFNPNQFYLVNSKPNNDTQDELRSLDIPQNNPLTIVKKKKKIFKKLAAM